LVLLTLLLGAAGGGAWYFLGGQQQATAHQTGTAASAKTDSSKPPVFVTLKPFTVNLQQDDGAPQYLQVGLSLKLSDDRLVDAIKLHMPEIRNRVLLLLSSKKASEISTLEGKKALSKELLHAVAQPLSAGAPAKGLDSVLFTSFVIQ
ncbi:MAG TPA: flagellar basal body-associated protein FliL, partial [Burkholderiales bacterium]|nr:flagellar basal body-associated protein FliL [Burkholderiales bacterium]